MPMYQRLQRLELCRLQLAWLHLASSRLAVPLATGQVQHAHEVMGGSYLAVPVSSLVCDYQSTTHGQPTHCTVVLL